MSTESEDEDETADNDETKPSVNQTIPKSANSTMEIPETDDDDNNSLAEFVQGGTRNGTKS